MSSILEKFTKQGFHYTQLKRSEKSAIYKQENDGFDQVYYEVIKIKVSKKETEYFGKVYPIGSESYPSSEQWGVFGWTFKSLGKAEAKFLELNKI